MNALTSLHDVVTSLIEALHDIWRLTLVDTLEVISLIALAAVLAMIAVRLIEWS